MRFKVVPFRDGEQRDDSVLQGIANGFGELYPVPDHPHGVRRLLTSDRKDGDDIRERVGARTRLSRKVVNES